MPTALEIARMAQARQAKQANQTPAPAAPTPAPVAPAPAPPPPAPTPAPTPAPAPAPVIKAVRPVPADDEDISTRAVLVNIHLSCPGNSKVDKKFTAEVKHDKRLGDHAGRWNKTKFPPEVYTPMASAFSCARSWHYANTLVYPETGWTMLPILNHSAYCEGFRRVKANCERARDEFLSKLDDIRAWAKREHNGNYDERLYDEEELRAGFEIGCHMRPVPSGSHFAQEIRDLVGEDAARIDSAVKDAVADAQAELWGRILEPLGNMVSILGKKEAGDSTRLDKSLVLNIASIAKLAPYLNLTADPKVDQFCEELARLVEGRTSENLSQDEEQRRETLRQAREIMARMTGAK